MEAGRPAGNQAVVVFKSVHDAATLQYRHWIAFCIAEVCAAILAA
jgi:hypothetical protein